MKGLMKWPLIIAAIVTVARVVLERTGAPESASGILSVVALHLLIVPVYFAIRIGKSGHPRPYLAQLKSTLLYVVLVRAMIIPVYWLAYVNKWPEQRFYPLAEPNTTAFEGWIGVPFVTAGVWIIASIVIGGAIGCGIIALVRRLSPGSGLMSESTDSARR